MERVEIYTKSWCPFCQRAKRLLADKGIAYRDYDVEFDSALLAEMLARSEGGRTVPQVFIDGQRIGGYDELFTESINGALERRLAVPARDP